MPLQKQKVQLSIVDGLDTKTDSKNVVPTKFLELENVVHTKTGSLMKREGYDAVGTAVFGGGQVTNGQALSQFKDELLQYANGALYSRSEAEASWVNKGAVRQSVATTQKIYAHNTALRHPTVVSADNFLFYAAAVDLNNNPTDLVYKLVDSITGTQLTVGTISNGSFPSAVYLSGKFHVFYYAQLTGTMRYFSIDPGTLAISDNLVSATVINPVFSAVTIGNRIFVAYSVAANNQIFTLFYNTDMTGSAPTLVTADVNAVPLFISVAKENINQVRFLWSRDVNNYSPRTVVYNYDLTSITGSLVPLMTMLNSADRVSKIFSATTGPAADIFITYRSGTLDADLLKITFTNGNTYSAPETISYNTLMLAEPLRVGDTTYLAVAKSFPVAVDQHNRTTFILDGAGTLVGKFFEDSTVLDEYDYDPNTVYQRKLCPGPRMTALNGKLLFVVPTLDAVTSSKETQFNDFTRIEQGALDFSAVSNYFDSALGDNLHITGSVMKMYDGQAVYEHGFVDPPSVLTVSLGATLDPLLAPDQVASPGTTYFYRAVYAWKDAQGQLHRSRPSDQLAVTLTKTTTSGPIDHYQYPVIQVPTTPFTQKDRVEVELYRASDTQPTFHKLLGNSGYSGINYNNKQTPILNVVDQQKDSDIESNEVLYTEGGTLENTAPIASNLSVVWRNRIVLLAADGRSLQYSKLRELNGPVEWAAELVITLDQIGGLGVSLGVMDDNLIIFKQRALQYVSGQGPDNTGSNDDFGRPSLITSDTGCLDPASVVQMPLGLMFKSEKGIYLLQRGQNLNYIGAGVEKYNNLTVTAAILRTNTNEVRFSTADGITLGYDYFHNRWSTHTQQTALDSIVKDGLIHYIRSSGTVMRQGTGYGDNGTPVDAKIVTAWMSLGGLQGFQRFYKLLILGNFKADHKLLVRFAYDFNESWIHEELIDASALLSTTEYGEGLYGAGEYGGQFPLYQFDIRPKIQKCSAFKVWISDVSPSGGSEGFTISNMAVEIGLENGLNRIKASRKFGAK